MKLKKNKLGYFFNPFEIAFCGFSNTGKTTLVSKLISSLKDNFSIGYVKHDAHKFSIDHEGKDTYIMKKAGAKTTFINDDQHFCSISHQELTQVELSSRVIDNDIVFIEGHKKSKLPKIVLLNSEKDFELTIEMIKNGEISEVQAIVSDVKEHELSDKYPSFNRDDIYSIKHFILKHLDMKVPVTLNALILTGGQSSRMGKDKGSLKYHGTNQIDYIKSLLTPFCREIFISCREDQKHEAYLKDSNLLHDTYPSIGPATGILSAQFSFPNSAWIVVACDLPYLDSETIRNLIKKRNPYKNATCYLNPKRNWPEPLCTIYEPKSHIPLMQYFANGNPCPRKVLFNTNIETLELANKVALDNVNTPEQRLNAQTYFKNGVL